MIMEYERLFSTSVYEKIREKVRAKVTVFVKDDILNIKVNDMKFGITYEKEIDDFANRICRGFNADLVAYEFVKEYRTEISKIFFK